MGGKVAFILKGYPRLSETFIAQEMLALERRGIELHIISLRHPTDRTTHRVHEEITAPVTYLPEYLHQEIDRVLRALWSARKLPGFNEVLRIWWRDFKRDPSRNRIRRLGQAFVLATELDVELVRLHAHFLHTPASVARYASVLTGIPWSVSAHAKDIWTSPDWEMIEKLASCDWAVTCTSVNHQHLSALAQDPRCIQLLYHGLDLERFPKPSFKADESGPVCVLSVGRAVDKKGYDDLLAALAGLALDLDWRFVHIGGGELADKLKAQAISLGIDERVTWMGPRSQDEVLRQYRQAHIFVLASRVSGNGDRDGLPNVLMEAQSQCLPCISTRVSAIPELIEDGATGLLVPERDRQALTCALERLIRDPGLRRRLGEAGDRAVRTRFALEANIEPLMEKLDTTGDCQR